jgi:hypothetical protein
MERALHSRFLRDRIETHLIDFLRDELVLEEAAIAIALKYWNRDTDPFHMILWHYGLISLEQLDRVFDWLRGQVPVGETIPICSNSLRNSP